MTFTAGQPVPLLVEININGVWVDVTSRARAQGQVLIKAARSPNASQAEASTLDMTLGNVDSWLTEDNPSSPWYGYTGRGMPIRVSLVGIIGAGVRSERFSGAIDTMQSGNPGGPDQTMHITAVGTIGQLNQGDVLKSALTRTMTGKAAGGYVAYASWSFEDESGSTKFASDLPGGTPLDPMGAVDFASNSESAGSLPLPVFGDGASVTAAIPAYADTLQWVVQFMIYVPAEPAVETTYAELRCLGGTLPLLRVTVEPGTPSTVHVRRYDDTQNAVVDVSRQLDGTANSPTEAQFFGNWVMITVSSNTVGNVETTLTISHDALTTASVTTAVGTYTATQLGSVRLFGTAAGIGFGHLAAFIDPSFNIGVDDRNNAAAMDGWAGEDTGARFARILREENLSGTGGVTGAQQMGPQPLAMVLDILKEVEAVDQGILHDQAPGGLLTLAAVRSMTNQAPALAIATDALAKDLSGSWDNQNTTNDVTSSRPGGSSVRLSDEASVAKLRGRYATQASVNVASDDWLAGDAGFRLAQGTAAGPRFTNLAVNLRNHNAAAYAAAVLGMSVGSRMTVAPIALPAQFPPGGLDQLLIGWQELLDEDTWIWTPNTVPYAPYLVAVYGTARYDSAASTLIAGVSSSATALQVFNATNIWTTDPAQFPFDLNIAGERMTATAIASEITDTFTRTTSSGWGTPTTTPGAVWTVAAGVTASIMSTNGTQALMTPPSLAPYDPVMLINVGSTTWDVKIRVVGRVAPVGGPTFDGFIAGYQNANNLYYVYAKSDVTTGAMTATIALWQSASLTVLAAVPIAPSLVSGDVFVRAAIDASSGLIRLKVWQASGTEPFTWSAQVTDTTFTSTQVGVWGAHNGTSPTTHTFDDFAVLNPQTFTVTRAVNGIAKAQAAGTSVRLWNTPRYGH